jgi:hypothetical protein
MALPWVKLTRVERCTSVKQIAYLIIFNAYSRYKSGIADVNLITKVGGTIFLECIFEFQRKFVDLNEVYMLCYMPNFL